MHWLKLYLAFGTVWVGGGVLIGYIRITSHRAPPAYVLMTAIVVWPRLLWGMIRNLRRGEPDGKIWP